MRALRRLSALTPLIVLAATGASADAPPLDDGTAEALDAPTAKALERLQARVPTQFFEQAYGYAVLPAVKRFGLGVGAAWGRGTVVEQGRVVGEARFWQATSGIQAGAAVVSLIVLFRDRAAMDEFRCNTVEFMGQAGLSMGPIGLLKTPAYRSGVAVFAAQRFGLMNEATIAVGKLSYHSPTGVSRGACSVSGRSGSVSDAALYDTE